jgi:redox-sensing transcriptional repressor
LRCLIQAQALGMAVINSVGIAEMAGTNAPQVRKDLSYLGELGTRGVGYDVDALTAHISERLGMGTERRIAIAGFGRMGSALFSYGGFAQHGFLAVAILDSDPEKVGTTVDGVTVRHIDELEDVLSEENVEILVLTTPVEVTREIAKRAAAVHVKAILNFAPVRLDLPADVAVRQVDLSTELQVLSFHLVHRAR